jgi:outer membrane protein TolC
MKRLFLTAVLVTGMLHAEPVPELPGLLPASVAQQLLLNDALVAAARAESAAAREDARLAEASPYEFTARANAQKRRVEPGAVYKEWNVGIERTLRLPGKAQADRRIAQAFRAEASAVYGEAMHEAARALLALWIDSAQAEQGRELYAASLEAARQNLQAVEQRVKAGDASRLDASLARAELAELERASIEARTAAEVAWARLHARFPGLARRPTALPAPQALAQPLAFWRERILAYSDELRLTAAARDKAMGEAERARAGRVPDPTVAIYTASELGGQERFAGIMLSMPIPGTRRAALEGKAVSMAEMALQQHQARRVEVEAAIASAVANAQGSYDAWRSAQANAIAMAENAGLVQRAYVLGETDLQALLSARRQANLAAQGALTSRATAAHAYAALLVDAHLVWGLDQH